jgi:hypothetical protein
VRSVHHSQGRGRADLALRSKARTGGWGENAGREAIPQMQKIIQVLSLRKAIAPKASHKPGQGVQLNERGLLVKMRRRANSLAMGESTPTITINRMTWINSMAMENSDRKYIPLCLG